MSTAKKIETRRQRVVHMDGLIELSGNSNAIQSWRSVIQGDCYATARDGRRYEEACRVFSRVIGEGEWRDCDE